MNVVVAFNQSTSQTLFTDHKALINFSLERNYRPSDIFSMLILFLLEMHNLPLKANANQVTWVGFNFCLTFSQMCKFIDFDWGICIFIKVDFYLFWLEVIDINYFWSFFIGKPWFLFFVFVVKFRKFTNSNCNQI